MILDMEDFPCFSSGKNRNRILTQEKRFSPDEWIVHIRDDWLFFLFSTQTAGNRSGLRAQP